MSFIIIQKFGFQVQSLYSSDDSKQLSYFMGHFPKAKYLNLSLTIKQVNLTNPTILLSINKINSNQNNQNSSISIQKVFSRNSSNEVHRSTRKGRGFCYYQI